MESNLEPAKPLRHGQTCAPQQARLGLLGRFQRTAGSVASRESRRPSGPSKQTLTALAGGPSGSLSSYGLPNTSCQTNDLTVAPDGTVWFTETSDVWGRLRRLDTQGKLTEVTQVLGASGLARGVGNTLGLTQPTAYKSSKYTLP